jgi:HD-like signal output (HDOD) protein
LRFSVLTVLTNVNVNVGFVLGECSIGKPDTLEDLMSIPLELRYQICQQPIDLPVFNPVALELLQLLASAETEINTVIETINKDQALSIQILRMANSSAYAGRYRSDTIKDSVNRLGIKQITNLAMAASQASLHTSELPIVNMMMQRLWQHSYACAVGCHSLACSTNNNALSDQAYMAGLLHDIGKLYLLKALEQISLTGENAFELDHTILRDVFSDMHVEQGYRIMYFWDIPPLYSSVVAKHHSDSVDANDTLLAIVRLVNCKSAQYDLNSFPKYLQPQDIDSEINALVLRDDILSLLQQDMQNSCV